jgi:cell wall-associated NlpC family hydrolase
VRKLLARGAGGTGETGKTSGHRTGSRRALAITSAFAMAGALGGAGALVQAGTAGAAPMPTIPQVQSELNSLQSQQDQIGQQYDQVESELAQAKAHLATVKKENSKAYAEYTAARKALQEVAIASYEDSGNSSLLGLVTSANPDSVLSQASLVEEIANLNNEQAVKFLAAAQAVQQAEDQVQRSELAIQQLASQVSAKQTRLNNLVASEDALLKSLSLQQDEELVTVGGGSTSGVDPYSQDTPALKAVYYVFQHLGDWYQWGATGPDEFDCSGLMMAAYAYAGITIPRDTYSQVAALPAISEAAMQPGDLMFFEGDGHVGMYVGNDMMIDAPATGQQVNLHSINEAWYAANFDSAAYVPGAGS